MQVERAVWITRAEPGATATAGRVRAMGLQPLVAPLLQVRALSAPPSPAGYDGLVFTSLNGVRFAPAPSSGPTPPVLAVGDATAEAARQAGYGDVASAGGDVGDLARLIGARFGAGARLLHLSAAAPAGDLAADVAPFGVRIDRAAIYETIDIPASPDPLGQPLHAILVHSPRGGAALAAHLAGRAANTALICISAAAATPLADIPGARLCIAPFPNEASLLKVLADA